MPRRIPPKTDQGQYSPKTDRSQHSPRTDGRRTPTRGARSISANKEKYSDSSDTESPDQHSNISKTSTTSTEKSFSNWTSPGSRSLSSKDSTSPSPRLYPSIEAETNSYKREKDESNRNRSSDFNDSNDRGIHHRNVHNPPSPQYFQYEDNSNKLRSSNGSSGNTPLFFLFIGVLFFVLYIFVFNNPFSTNPMTEKPKRGVSEIEYELFMKEVSRLNDDFPNQNDRLWRSVIASSRHILKEANSTYPSVIILASQVKAPQLSICIARKIASSFMRSRGFDFDQIPSTDIEDIKNHGAHKQKLMLDQDIQAAFQTLNTKTFVIRNLQSLSPQAALLLHGLCDGDNAPYKDVMILMTLEVPEDVPKMTAHQVEDYLTDLWTTSEVEYDKVTAVMSRISNNLLLLQSESPEVLERICPNSK